MVGDESFVEYGPLIAGGLSSHPLGALRCRELLQEAVDRLLKGTVLAGSARETAETFLAGVVFSLYSGRIDENHFCHCRL